MVRRKKENTIVKRAIRTKYTIEQTITHLNEIYERVKKPIVLVNHIAHTGIEKIDASRANITSMLAEIASTNNKFLFFDTGPVIKKSEIESPINGNDHYSKEFEPTIGEAILNGAKNHWLNHK